MESALFQQRLRAMHMNTASKRREEQELKVLSDTKNREKKASKRKSRQGHHVLHYLSALIFGSSVERYYSRFARADQLWEEEDNQDAEAGEARC